jgi:hypothetical protein
MQIAIFHGDNTAKSLFASIDRFHRGRTTLFFRPMNEESP